MFPLITAVEACPDLLKLDGRHVYSRSSCGARKACPGCPSNFWHRRMHKHLRPAVVRSAALDSGNQKGSSTSDTWLWCPVYIRNLDKRLLFA
jgi:hypothetical protein